MAWNDTKSSGYSLLPADWNDMVGDQEDKIDESILSAKGSLVSATTAETPANLSVGTNDYVIVADSSASTGLKWIAPLKNTLSAKGSLISATAASTPVNLSVGSNGDALLANSSETSGLEWTSIFGVVYGEGTFTTSSSTPDDVDGQTLTLPAYGTYLVEVFTTMRTQNGSYYAKLEINDATSTWMGHESESANFIMAGGIQSITTHETSVESFHLFYLYRSLSTDRSLKLRFLSEDGNSTAEIAPAYTMTMRRLA